MNDSLLKKWFDDQLRFQQKVIHDLHELEEKRKIELTKEMALSIVCEIDELLEATGQWKIHRREIKYPTKVGIAEELVDMMKFLINIAIIWGITPEELVKVWDEKTVFNEIRFLQEQKLMEFRGKPVAIFDIDGTLNDFPEKWVSFINEQLLTKYYVDDLFDLPRFINYETYEQLKHDFFERHFDTIQINPEAPKVLSELKARGVVIVLLSAKPVKRYKRLLHNEISKLMNAGIPFDIIIYDREKGLRIMKDFPKVLFAVEDDPRQAEDIARYGIRALLIKKPYNENTKVENVIKIKSLREVMRYVPSRPR